MYAPAMGSARKVAVITGGGSGLGAALGKLFAGEGMAVAVLDIDEAAARQTAAELAGGLDVPTAPVRVDVGDAGSIAEAARRVTAQLGGCDVLCANVGVQQFGAIDHLTDDDWRFVLDVNVLGTVRTVRAFLPLLRARDGWRRIVLTASSSVLAPGVRMAAYQTTKFAVMGFGETLREELAPEGIGVTIMFPGGMITRHLESSAEARPAALAATGAQPDDLDAMLAHRPLAEGDVVMPEHAVRNLLADLRADEPYSLTHGGHRPVYEQRRAAMDAAFDRMEAE
jgi:NAD(P)-dependent dehydrogenase (short-subunit alcohol dehydrogenase family)